MLMFPHYLSFFWIYWLFPCLEPCGWISYPLSLIWISIIWCFYCLLHLLNRTTTLNQFFNKASMLSWQSSTAKPTKQPYVSPKFRWVQINGSKLIWVLNEPQRSLPFSPVHFSHLFLTSSFLDSLSSYISFFPYLLISSKLPLLPPFDFSSHTLNLLAFNFSIYTQDSHFYIFHCTFTCTEL